MSIVEGGRWLSGKKNTVPSRRLKFSGFCVWKFCVRMGQRAWSNQRGALTLNPPHFGLGDRSIGAGQLISSLKALCRKAWTKSPVTFGFDLETLHHPLRRTDCKVPIAACSRNGDDRKTKSITGFHKYDQRIARILSY